MQSKINLLNLNQKALDEFFKKLGEKSYRTKQIMKWIYKDQVFDFDQMLNLSKKLREQLKEISCIEFPSVVSKSHALDGVIKWVVELGGENHVEMVYIPEKDRGTLCISSQVGCALACTFCSTGYQGFNRNLSTAEIIAQVLIANLHLNPAGKRISNVVFMGMGEPMLNEEAVYSACDLLMDDLSFGLSRRRVTISSSGVVPALERMSERVPVSLAISLHAPNNTLRDELVPINKKYPIEALMKACDVYLNAGTQERHILFEYVMLKGVNDSSEHAQQLAQLLKGVSAKVNLIPFNPFSESEYQTSSIKTVENFQNILFSKGIRTMTRRTRGEDVDAACGQLAGKVKDKTKRTHARRD
ncbi:23S rRNA (adenine(2503)-C(2))-methyltransferase RlmN [Candidatus Thioglobus sp.]|jgi:23S rRNA (adenine2503-C2)-methyltransferase|uniref:23S rRNA (adenine(2503)-C(2))-methyltransferase RlmN n=1 Tax=Candidatus Thioglobus sp. TaxID=2026721 RepID=UPI001E143708|nr:23S rRNA (adenine(2503)-C(2))-methyltransferase RlmN [Candidatus Thioglobus sp.]MBT3277113.1 23S rRNA (adenine(2503)-C(2))-methyltransferase RlmN [Candidatus Thioglobus sp.]MBT3446758.1 23S rRNA (adenine(2503)-C(2))-methyltransferase RlmN [Candidatus Thioglobus sp.]MBT3744579.1 23S rRNA (adenine(2503)-C(2))-methyltransferase RlmN [Candidatus Thioglobus sp.]MBT4001591.1 23S rRNA (adenine(2503)-C(2))-methyltransferase RlmN [Candidatus Thioglobus sp.]MBT4181379.1 23S rRNA (adenine(2503)-C(2))-